MNRTTSRSVTLLPGQTYTLSAYVKTEDVQGCGNGAFLRLASADGWTQVDSEPVTGSTPAAAGNEMPADGWQRIKLNYEHASNAEETFTVRLMAGRHCRHGVVLLPAAGDRHGGQLRQPPEQRGLPSQLCQRRADAAHGLGPVQQRPHHRPDQRVPRPATTPDFPAALEGNYMQIEGRPDKVEYVGFGQELDIQGKKNDVLVWRRLGQRPQRAPTPPSRNAALPSWFACRILPASGRTTHCARLTLNGSAGSMRATASSFPLTLSRSASWSPTPQLQLRQVLEPLPLS